MSPTPLDPSYDRQTSHSMAELSLIAQLKSAASKTQEDAGILFSSDLVDTFLYDENPAKNDSVEEILSALDKNTSINPHLLDTVTLRCLAYILLNSGIEAGQERGLYILLDGPQSSARYGLMESQSITLPSTDHSRLARRRLLHILYRIFMDVGRGPGLRRPAGKILIEMMLESGGGGALLLDSQEQQLAGLVSTASNEPDVILRFFASFIIRILHLSGINTEFQTPDNATYRRSFFYGPCIGNDEILKLYHSYIHEARQETSMDQGVQLEDANWKKGSAHTCYVLQSIHIDTITLAKGTILAFYTTSSLLFIYPAVNIHGNFSYIEVPMQSIVPHMRSSVRQWGGKESLCLRLNPANLISINGRAKVMKGQTLILQSNDDVTRLQKAIDGTGDGIERNKLAIKSRVRRSSTLVVPLDTAGEIIRKSKRVSEAKARREADTSNCAIPSTMPHRAMSQDSDTDRSIPTRGLKVISPDGHQRRIEEHKLFDSGNALLSNLTEGKEHLHTDEPCPKEEQRFDILHGNLMMRNSVPDQDSGAFTILHERIHNERRQNRVSKPAAITSQSRYPRRKSKTNLQLSNTQESLIFHPQRSYKKVYTGNTKAGGDWDKYIRPTGDCKGSEVTSVSSPVSGDIPAFDKRQIIGRGSRNLKEKSPAKPRKKMLANSSYGTIENTGSRSDGVPHEETIENTISMSQRSDEPIRHLEIDTQKEIYGDTLDSERLASGKCMASDSSTTEASAKSNSSLPGTQGEGRYTTAAKFSLASKGGNEDHERRDTSVSKHSRSSGVKNIGRGENVGKKLAAALQLDRESSDRGQDQIHSHDSLESRGSHNSTESAPPSTQPRKALSKANLAELDVPWDNEPDHDGNYEISRSSDTGRLLAITVAGTCHKDPQEVDQNSYQDAKHSFETMSADTEQEDTDLSNEERREEKARRKESISSINLAQSPCQAQISRVETPIIRSPRGFDSPDNTTEEAKSCPCNGSGEEPSAHSVSPAILGTAILGDKSSDSARSPYTDNRQGQGGIPDHSRISPKKSIVDKNGSPRLLSRVQNDLTTSGGARQSRQLALEGNKASVGGIDHESGYDGGLEESCAEEVSDPDRMPAPTPCRKSPSGQTRNPLGSPTKNASSEWAGPFSRGTSTSFTKHARESSLRSSLLRSHEGRTQIIRDPYRTAPLLSKEHDHINNRGQGSYRSPPQGELASIGSLDVDENAKLNDGDTAVQALQRETRDMLLASSEHFMRRLENERQTLFKALETYRQQCYNILDCLYEAQEERINLCGQQMHLIRHNHTKICEELKGYFEAKERGVPKRTNRDSTSEERKWKKRKKT
ncbi:hypothetical protein ETB97_000706 [Aspergillus alliaceus]|uniref:Uncharacterized protein n=1 Tax=Petromyces alliaceus TaxID=209559 RepID=A0A8H6AF71_PETAA|nr:hypothetical protein ETB97_000706 [Aspergillus burnettii]